MKIILCNVELMAILVVFWAACAGKQPAEHNDLVEQVTATHGSEPALEVSATATRSVITVTSTVKPADTATPYPTHTPSLTKFYQDASAAKQAQKVWDQSLILQQYKAGKVSRAR